MDTPDNVGSPNLLLEPDSPVPENSAAQKEIFPANMLSMKQQMSNQCFEMAIKLNTERSKSSGSTSEPEIELPDYINELERVKMVHFNSSLALHRMQMWHAIGEKMKSTDPEADELTTVSNRCMALCSRIKQLQEETKHLQDEIIEIQRRRLELKQLTHDKMKEMEALLSSRERQDTEKYKAMLEKGQANLEKYKKMTIMTQNVLRGVLLACKVNWLDDPSLREIAMTLEEFPISD